MPPVRSNVWNLFIKTSSGGKCKLCHCEVKTAGNTTNLRKHLQRRHASYSETEGKRSPILYQDENTVSNEHFLIHLCSIAR